MGDTCERGGYDTLNMVLSSCTNVVDIILLCQFSKQNLASYPSKSLYTIGVTL